MDSIVVVGESPVTLSGKDAAVLEMDPSAGVSWGIKWCCIKKLATR